VQGDGAASGQADDEWRGGRHIAAGGHEATAEQRECVVNGRSLDDTVEVQLDRLGAHEQRSAKRERLDGRHPDGSNGRPVDREAVEIVVIPCGHHGCPDGWGDQTACRPGSPERLPEHL